ncbi:MAG: terminase small subunit [Paraclostridium sp.]
MSKLTEKQKAFCDFYIESLNATESYSRAYDNDNIKSCEARGSQLLRNVKVKEYIDSRLQEVRDSRILTLKDIMEFHSKVVNNDYKALGYNKPLYLKDRQVSAEALTKRLELMENKGTDNAIKVKIIKASEALCKK